MDDSEEHQTEANVVIVPEVGKNDTSCCNPQSRVYRFLGLMFMCLLGFGPYFCYDGPGALREHFENDMNMKTSEFVLLYAWYSWPSVVLCCIGGFLIDRVFGIRLGTSIFAGLVVLGQLVFALGAVFNAFWLMIVGRFIFGIGAESLAVAQNYYAVLWFKGKELNMVFGFQLSFARVGSTVNFLVMEPIYKWVGKYYKGHMCTAISLFLAGITCIVSFICTLILAWMDKRVEKSSKRSNNQDGTDVIQVRDIKDFPATFWMISIICVAYYAAIFPFIALGKVFFERKFDFDPNAANRVNSFVYLISIITSPIMGWVVDRTGRNVFWVFLSILFSMASHAILAFTFLNPFIGMSALGLAYSMLASALWPMVAIVIPEYQLGTAYGITQSVQNLGLAVITMWTGKIVDNGGYLLLEVFFLAWLCVSLVTIIVIWIYDSLKTGILNMSVKQRELYESNKLANEEREKLLASGSATDSVPNISQPQSDFHIRNRYLSRIGAVLPSHYNGTTRGPPYRALRKARQYKIDQARSRRSVIQSDSPGYESCECHEKHAFEERDRNLKMYHDSFDCMNFGEGKDSMYENFTEKTKRIRIIRELSESKLFQCEKSAVDQSWFLRFCTLSRFIQAARMIILKQRLEKRLNILKRLTPAIVDELERLDPSFEEKLQEYKNPCLLPNPLCPIICST